MSDHQYLILGGGMAADAAAHGIRELDPDGTIGLIASETDPPYNRPPLSKGLWKGDALESIWRKTGEAGVDLMLGRTATAIDPDHHQVTDDLGQVHGYGKLLIATGVSPRQLPFGESSVIYYRTAADFRRLHAIAARRGSVVVIGGGFIGSEIAAALTLNGVTVAMLFPEDAIGARLYPADLAQSVTAYYREQGVDVRPGEAVVQIEQHERHAVVSTKSGARIIADIVVAGVGVQPNVALATAAGIAAEDGILVDDHLMTARHDIYAAGDVARFMASGLGRRTRVEHEDNALTMGRAAGRAMAGDQAVYHHLPFFYSDLFDLGYEAVGETDARLETVADWTTPFREGVVYYLHEGRVRGVLLWGIFGQVDAARALIAEPGPFTATTLHGRIAATP